MDSGKNTVNGGAEKDSGKMEIQINGDFKQFAYTQMNIHDLLVEIGLNPEQTGIAVALNLSVVPKGEWAETMVKGGDEVDVITARQGG